MRIRLQSVLPLVLAVALLFSGLYIPQTVRAVDSETPERD